MQRGDRVRVLDNLSSGLWSNLAHLEDRVERQVGDVCDPAAVVAAAVGVDAVFHEAALASVPASVRDPLASHAACATGTVQVLESARRAGVRRVVIAASSAAYGDRPSATKRESDPVDPLSPYAAAKIASELYAQAFSRSLGVETVSLRYFNVFGPRQDPASEYSAVIPIFVTKMLRGERPTVYGDGLQSRDFVYVEDVVRANLLAADAPQASGRVINVGSGRRLTLLDLIGALNRALGTQIAPLFAPPRAGDVRESLADITAARAVLGYEPSIDFDEGLRRSIDYYRGLTAKPRADAR